MRGGRLDGLIAQIVKATRGTVVEAYATGAFSSADGRLQAEVSLSETGESLYADVLMSAAGGGAVLRLPTADDVCLVALIGGELSSGYVLGWFAAGDAPEVPDATYLIEPRPGEHVLIRTSANGNVEIDSSAEVTVTAATKATVTAPQVVIDSPDIRAGSDSAVTPVAEAPDLDVRWGKLYTVLSAWPVTPSDGGAALKLAFATAFPTPPTSVASSKLKTE